MNIQPFQANMVRHLVRAYNRAIKPIPHCYRVDEHYFQHELENVLSGEPGETRRDEAIYIAVDQRKLVGFVHVAVGPPKPKKDTVEEGLIRFLWYTPGMREAGDLLLDKAEEHCRALGMTAMNAYPQKHRYSFYLLKSAYMSDRLGHVAALLGMAGYRRTEGEVYMDLLDFSVDEPEPLPGYLEAEVEHNTGLGRLPNVTLTLTRDGDQIAICENVSAGEFSRDRSAQEWIFTQWMHIDDEHQGLGLGRYMLMRGLWEAQNIGYRHASISTAWDNYRAFLFYTNLGYQVVDWTYGYRKELE